MNGPIGFIHELALQLWATTDTILERVGGNQKLAWPLWALATYFEWRWVCQMFPDCPPRFSDMAGKP